MSTYPPHDYDFIIIGSGFGGSVSALRLSEKGYRVLVLEKGRWYKPEDFPKTNWQLKRWLWMPALRWFGILKLTFFRHVTVLSGVGVGGGSLVYANTLAMPKPTFFRSGSWKNLADWEKELGPFYERARRMLGAASNPLLEEGDRALKQMAADMGRSSHFSPTDVAVFFGEPGKTVADPYFQGQGPERAGCTFCGACMTGCRYTAKNTLDKNSLYLAQGLGAKIRARCLVSDVFPMGNEQGSDGYLVRFRDGEAGKTEQLSAKGIVFAGGVLGTVPLLLKLKAKSMPHLSDRLGDMVRTNNESLIPVTSFDRSREFSRGVAIGSILHTDEDSHLEPVRYGPGSGFWRLLLLPLVSGASLPARLGNMLLDFLRRPWQNLRVALVDDWSRRTQIMLFMQHLDSTLRFSLGRFGLLKSTISSGKAPSPFIPQAQELADQYSRLLDGKPMVFFMEPLFSIPSTAHILGGAVMGSGPEEGVIDSNNRVFGYENVWVCDGSAISANPGVNPALTITAIAERAMNAVAEKATSRNPTTVEFPLPKN